MRFDPGDKFLLSLHDIYDIDVENRFSDGDGSIDKINNVSL